MRKIAGFLEREMRNLDESDSAGDCLAASALDFTVGAIENTEVDSEDLVRVTSSLLVGFADALDADGKCYAADRVDAVLAKIAKNPHFWEDPADIVRKRTPVSPPRESLGPLGHSLQSRHSPDLLGVSLVREEDGVYRDPITNKIYDFNKGFVLDDGTEWVGGSVSAQTPNVYEKRSPVKQQVDFKSKG